MSFNENSRVKIPAVLYLCRLGFKYLSLKNVAHETSTNIFTDIFASTISTLCRESCCPWRRWRGQRMLGVAKRNKAVFGYSQMRVETVEWNQL